MPATQSALIQSSWTCSTVRAVVGSVEISSRFCGPTPPSDILTSWRPIAAA